jgi:hypothetical protein
MKEFDTVLKSSICVIMSFDFLLSAENYSMFCIESLKI